LTHSSVESFIQLKPKIAPSKPRRLFKTLKSRSPPKPVPSESPKKQFKQWVPKLQKTPVKEQNERFMRLMGKYDQWQINLK
jgi:hypothetical protein